MPKSQGQPWQVIDSSVRYDSTAVIPGTNDKPHDHGGDDDDCGDLDHKRDHGKNKHDKDRDGADHDDECDRDHDHNRDGRHDRKDHDRHHDDCRNAWNGHGQQSKGFVASWKWR